MNEAARGCGGRGPYGHSIKQYLGMEVRRGYAAGWRLTTQKEEWSLEMQAGWALVGFTCAGAGLATIIPNTFAAAGNIEGSAPGPSLAVVTTAGYVGFLAGPPLIGFAAQLSTIRAALWILVVLSGLSASHQPQ